MAKRDRPVSLEELAARMMRSMNSPARHRKTRDYIASLPPRKKVRITAADYPQRPAPAIVTIEPIKRKASKATLRMAPSPIIARDGRKDRLRPRAKPQPAAVPSRWACRPAGRHRKPWARQAPKLIRTLELTMQQRFLLHVAQLGRCGLCGDPMQGTPFSLSLDHVIPRSLDGPDGLGNLLLCHGECNGAKTNDIPTGCEMVWLLAVNARLGVRPLVF